MLKDALIDYDPATGRVAHPPRQVYVGLTSRCNLDCVHCPTDYGRVRGADLPFEALRKLAPFLATARFVNLNVIGEPLMAARFVDAIRLCSAGGAEISFNTNATLVTEAIAELLVAEGVSSIAASIDGIDAHRRLRGSPYETARDGLVRLGRAKERAGRATPHLALCTTLMRSNLHELVPLLRDLLPRVRLHALHLQPLVVFWENLREENVYGAPELARVLDEAQAECGRHGVLFDLFRSQLEHDERFRAGDRPPLELGAASATYGCTDPFFEFKVRSDGAVEACGYGLEPGANLLDPGLDLDDLWNGPWYRELRRRLYAKRFEGRCATCPHVCGGVANQLSSLQVGVEHSRAARMRAAPR